MQTVYPIETIVSDPEIRNGKRIIAGTRVALIDIVSSYNSGRSGSPEEIAYNYNLTLGQVFAALAYYYDYRDQVEAELAHERARADTLIDDLRMQGKLIDLD